MLNHSKFSDFQKFFNNINSNIQEPPHDTSLFVGYNNVNDLDISNFFQHEKNNAVCHNIQVDNYEVQKIDNILDIWQSNFLTNIYSDSIKENLSTHCVQRKYGQENNGIKRMSFYHYDLALLLFFKIYPFIERYKNLNGQQYYATQINPLLRFIEYQNSNYLVPHYDKSIVISDTSITLSTIIFYLSTNTLGQTRFLKDHQQSYSDNLNQYEVLYDIAPIKGQACIFDHNILHDSNFFKKQHSNEENKLILTSEIVYQKM